ncbi:MAG: T9SS type A sorting domain-containing protein [Bacteroidota bacterium]
MKKLYSLVVAGILTGSMSAQQIQKKYTFGNNLNNEIRAVKQSHMKGSVIAQSQKSSAMMRSGYIDYSWNSQNDLSYVWRFNSLYTAADTSFNYICVALNQFGVFDDYADNVLDVDYMGSNVFPATMSIDSVFVLMTHENNSGNYNTVGVDIVKLNTAGAPTTSSTVLFSVRDSANTTLSPGGNWVGQGASFVLPFAPGYTVNCSVDKVGLNFIYKGPDSDTASVVGSSIDDGSGGTTTQSAYATSYMRYPPYINGITANRNITYQSGGYIETQDWEVWAKVSFDDATIGWNENTRNDFKVYQNMPNPFNNTTTIRYNLTKATDVKFELTDMSGRVVMEKTFNNLNAGEHSMELSANQLSKGIYIYSFDVNGYKTTKRLVIE